MSHRIYSPYRHSQYSPITIWWSTSSDAVTRRHSWREVTVQVPGQRAANLCASEGRRWLRLINARSNKSQEGQILSCRPIFQILMPHCELRYPREAWWLVLGLLPDNRNNPQVLSYPAKVAPQVRLRGCNGSVPLPGLLRNFFSVSHNDIPKSS